MPTVQVFRKSMFRVRNIKQKILLGTETTEAPTMSNTVLFQLALKNGLVRDV